MTAHRVSAGPVRLKRAYEPAAAEDGVRVLVDRLWPRGIRKEDAAIDHWMKEVAPSSALRQWFGHDPDRWPEFRRRYAGRVRVDFPAASPHALGCGGAAITVSEGRIVTESV